jgi:hypothetical protein
MTAQLPQVGPFSISLTQTMPTFAALHGWHSPADLKTNIKHLTSHQMNHKILFYYYKKIKIHKYGTAGPGRHFPEAED